MKKKAKLKNASRSGGQISKFDKAIGQRVKELSEERGGSTVSLGKAIGISQAQISRLQNGLQGFRSGTLFKIGVPELAVHGSIAPAHAAAAAVAQLISTDSPDPSGEGVREQGYLFGGQSSIVHAVRPFFSHCAALRKLPSGPGTALWA